MRVFCFGIGYSALASIDLLREMGWHISGTTRSTVKQEKLASKNIKAVLFGADKKMDEEGIALLQEATHILISIPPQGELGDIVFKEYGHLLPKLPNLQWVGYLSSTGVYGDYDGDWVDEKTKPMPTLERRIQRHKAEQQWLSLAAKKVPIHVFRLSGIYGPGRSVVDSIRKGENIPVIAHDGHYHNRIHIEDIATIVNASMMRPAKPGTIYNVTDDEPTLASDVVRFAYELVGKEPPLAIPFDAIKDKIKGKALDSYIDNKRVRNQKIKDDLDVILSYPTYREGLRDCQQKAQP